MASYKGEVREYYNIRRRIESTIKRFEKAGLELPAQLVSSRIDRILSTTPAKASKGLLNEARIVANQMTNSPKRFNVRQAAKMRQEILKYISAPPEYVTRGGRQVNIGGLGYTNVTQQNQKLFFEFMDYVRDKYENMRFDSDIFAAAANEMLGQAARRKVSAADLQTNFERFAEQAIRITSSNTSLNNYQHNFNRLARRLGL